jgi:hypothetical protein
LATGVTVPKSFAKVETGQGDSAPKGEGKSEQHDKVPDKKTVAEGKGCMLAMTATVGGGVLGVHLTVSAGLITELWVAIVVVLLVIILVSRIIHAYRSDRNTVECRLYMTLRKKCEEDGLLAVLYTAYCILIPVLLLLYLIWAGLIRHL